MPDTAGPLCYAVRPKVLRSLLGQFCFLLAILALPVVLVAALSGEWTPFFVNLSSAATLGLAGVIFGRGPSPKDLLRNEAVTLVCLVFLLGSLAMAVPLLFDGISFPDALFESISALTTTGLSTLATVEDKSTTFLFSRAWRQWYGGLGIVVFSLALLHQSGATAKGLTVLESEEDDLVGGVKTHMRDLLRIYVVLTLAAILLIWLTIPDFFTALAHALAAVSTGGFSTMDNSLAGGGPSFAIAVTVASVAGAFPLVFFWRSYKRQRRHIFLWIQVIGVVILGLLVSSGLALSLHFQSGAAPLSWGESIFQGAMMGFSAQSTTGFSTMPVADMPDASKLMLILAMFVGGGAGSTAGGVKALRFFIAIAMLHSIVRRACLTRHAFYKTKLAGVTLDKNTFEDALSLIFVYVLVLALSWLTFLAYGYPALDSLFEVTSALGTAGISSGLCGPDLPMTLKGVLAANMLLGRLEVMAWLILLSPWNWTPRRK